MRLMVLSFIRRSRITATSSFPIAAMLFWRTGTAYWADKNQIAMLRAMTSPTRFRKKLHLKDGERG